MKLLLVEDEKELAAAVQEYLRGEGFVCEWAPDFRSAGEKIGTYDYDCIFIDITLPGGNGLQLIPEIKDKNNTSGIIIISAKNSLDDKIKGLDLGADDYLTKPFHLPELNSRLRSVLRRRKMEGKNEICFEKISVHPDKMEVKVSGNILSLTKKEFDLLLYFITNKERVLTKEAIAEHLWGDNIDSADSFDFLYSHVKNLRKFWRREGMTISLLFTGQDINGAHETADTHTPSLP